MQRFGSTILADNVLFNQREHKHRKQYVNEAFKHERL